MKQLNILLSGYTGYVGQLILSYLRSNGHSIFTLGKALDADVRLDLTDLSSFKPDRSLFSKLDFIIHAAAANEVICKLDPEYAQLLTINATQQLYGLSQAFSAQFIYISTAHVFGPYQGQVKESSTPSPVSTYGMLHHRAEQYLLDNQLSSVLRLGNLLAAPASWNTFNRWTLAPFDLTRQALLSGSIQLNTSGQQRRNWTMAETLFRSVDMLLYNNRVRVVHATGNSLSVLQLAGRIADSIKVLYGQEITITAASPEPVLRTLMPTDIGSHYNTSLPIVSTNTLVEGVSRHLVP
ncbi:NAD-dependent epimerase/dehydratase family protein [Synechococcus sp. W4D4]|uniref:NAD-dependent epimerase/dehydratase family protein n=1 Tax=Synechococcus sp. W4D4 TaxID=3392294 RepID=UPI0039E7EEA5